MITPFGNMSYVIFTAKVKPKPRRWVLTSKKLVAGDFRTEAKRAKYENVFCAAAGKRFRVTLCEGTWSRGTVKGRRLANQIADQKYEVIMKLQLAANETDPTTSAARVMTGLDQDVVKGLTDIGVLATVTDLGTTVASALESQGLSTTRDPKTTTSNTDVTATTASNTDVSETTAFTGNGPVDSGKNNRVTTSTDLNVLSESDALISRSHHMVEWFITGMVVSLGWFLI